MANTCCTDIIITGGSCQEEFYEKIKNWLQKDGKEKGVVYHSHSLENLVLLSEAFELKDGEVYYNGSSLKYNGDASDPELSEEGAIKLMTFTAWVPMITIWKGLCEKHNPGAEIIYTAEEPGFSIYVTNDESMRDVCRLYITEPNDELTLLEEDAFSKIENVETEISKQQALEIMNSLLNASREMQMTPNDFESVFKAFSESKWANFVYINPFQFNSEEIA